MFVRKKVNRSGSTSVVVVDKGTGRFRQIKCFGTSSDPKEIGELVKQANIQWTYWEGG